MPVTIIKVECPNHRGRYTMGGPCDLCIKADCEAEIDKILARAFQEFGRILRDGLDG